MSVRKRTWRTSKGEVKEAWIVDYTDQAGHRHIETFERKKDADAKHAEVKVDVKKGVHVAPSKSITVEKAAEAWLKEARDGGLERATVKTYGEHVRLHINPLIGSYKLSEISVPVVTQFKKDLRAKGRSQVCIKKVVVSLGSIIADAQEGGLASHNAVRDLRRNKKRGGKQEQRHKRKLKTGVDIPTKEEVSAIIRHAPDRWRALLVVAAFTGLRASELRGLRWADVDLKKRELHVTQRADCFAKMGPPKSGAGARTVPFGSFVANTLKEWKLKHPGELVFASLRGKVMEHSDLVKASIIPASIAAGLLDKDGKPKYTGLHCLRHFYASWCIDRGMPPKVVQERMGHSSIVMTMDVYGHLFPRGDDSAEIDAAEDDVMALGDRA